MLRRDPLKTTNIQGVPVEVHGHQRADRAVRTQRSLYLLEIEPARVIHVAPDRLAPGAVRSGTKLICGYIEYRITWYKLVYLGSDPQSLYA